MSDQLRGFARWKADGRGAEISELAKRGGRAAHEQGRAHRYTPEEARAAGRLGGLATAAKKRAAREAGHG